MSDTNNLHKQIQETKKTTDELKAQLQQLIELRNLGKTTTEKENLGTLKAPHEKLTEAANLNIKPVLSLTNEKNKPVTNQHICSSRRERNYDVHQAREYIKKQRELRSVQPKSNEIKVRDELKKQKLQELHAKAQELVLKNVQLSRKRSKSRENQEFIRPDNCDQMKNRSLSNERNNLKLANENQSTKQKFESKSTTVGLKKDKDQQHSKVANPIPSPKDYSNVKKNATSSQHENNEKRPGTSKINIISNITLRKPEKETLSPNNEGKYTIMSNTPKVSPLQKHEEQDEKKNQNSKLPQTITKEQNYPDWLNENLGIGDPFNFINTVKKKLQYTLSPSKNVVDKGIQSNLMLDKQPHFTNRNNIMPFENQCREDASFLKSFNSHQHQNLDVKPIEKMEISSKHIQKQISKDKTDGFTQYTNTFLKFKMEDEESESDTSKNIPEISTESGTSLKKNAESVRRNLSSEFTFINSSKIKDMKLVPKLKHSPTQLKPEARDNCVNLPGTYNQPPSTEITENIYDPDFESEDFISPCLSRSRESIISFNSPEYIEQKIYLPTSKYNTQSLDVKTSEKQIVSKNNTQSLDVNNKISTHVSSSNNPPAKKLDIFTDKKETSTKMKPTANIPEIIITPNISITSKGENITNPSSNIPSSIHEIDNEFYSSQKESVKRNGNYNEQRESSESPLKMLPLEEPKVSLTYNAKKIMTNVNTNNNNTNNNHLPKNISVRQQNVTEDESNEIHFKFEAEIHLLNDFNQTLRQLNTVEKVVESLKSQNILNGSNILQNKDTQSSAAASSSSAGTKSTKIIANKSKSDNSGINYSRGTHSDNLSIDNNIFESSLWKSKNGSSNLSKSIDISQVNINGSSFENALNYPKNFENLPGDRLTWYSVTMLDQLIKDEDARLEHLKMILKIREKALLDRVRAELACLEIQRKHYKETGNLQEVSVIKKKQRGILLNHQKEKHEMQRVKQMQRAASVERKIILKEQRNLIRKQLSTDNMLTKMKVNTPRKRVHGPLKVIQSHTESVVSETSISRKSSTEKEDIFSVISHRSVSRMSEISEIGIESAKEHSTGGDLLKRQQEQHLKKSLLMREAALRKRRKLAEELLRWNQKLLEEEKMIVELERQASSIIPQHHNKTSDLWEKKHTFTGKGLNKLWYYLTGCEERKFAEDKTYRMSQVTLERFCKSAKEYSIKTKNLLSKGTKSDYGVVDLSVSDSTSLPTTVQSSRAPSETEQRKDDKQDNISNVSFKEYTSDFEVETTENVVELEDIDVNENIDELIHNFSRIEDDISSLSSSHVQGGARIKKGSKESLKSNRTGSEGEENNQKFKQTTESSNQNTSKDFEQSSEVVEEIVTDEVDIPHTNEQIELVSPENPSEKSFLNKSDNLSVSTELKDNLNKSKEILLLLSKSEFLSQSGTENINTSLDILSTLNQLVDLVSGDRISDESALKNISEKRSPIKDSSIIVESVKDVEVKNAQNVNSLLEKQCDVDLRKDYLEISKNGANKEQVVDVIDLTAEPDDQNDSVIIIPDALTKTNEDTDIEEELSTDVSVKRSNEKDASFLVENVNAGLDNKSQESAINTNPIPITTWAHDEHSKTTIETYTTEFEKDANSSHMISVSVIPEEVKESTKDDPSNISSETQPELLECTSLEPLEDKSTCEDGEKPTLQTPTTSITTENETERYRDNFDVSSDSTEDVRSGLDSKEKSDSRDKSNESPSISSSNTSRSSSVSERKSASDISTDKSKSSKEFSPKSEGFNVKKRISEILAETNTFTNGSEKSPRFQDFYTTTYDLVSPTCSPDSGSPVDEQLKIAAISSIFGNEAEEILKKQLAIEQEIKQITEQQQKQQLPYMYVREIPNKPPPPYTPPSSLSSVTPSVGVIPNLEEINEITKYAAKILHKAYLSNNLDNISVSDNTLNLIAKNIPKDKYKFVFDLCKDLSKTHYKQFDEEKGPSWMRISKKPQLIIMKPFEVNELEKYMGKKLREVFGYEKPNRRENSIIKWSRKKTDPVGEVLVGECQAEEEQWINYEKDELLVTNQVTTDIMSMLLEETAEVYNQILSKRLQ